MRWLIIYTQILMYALVDYLYADS